RLVRLERGHDAHRGAQDARGVAGGRAARRRESAHEARKARALPREHRHHHAVAAHAAAVDPGAAELDAGVVQQEARLEVVRAVQDEIDVPRQLLGVGEVDVADAGVEPDLRVDPGELGGRGRRLRQRGPDVLLVVEDLALEVVELDEVAVAKADEADPRADEVAGEGRAERAQADDRDARAAEALLALPPQRREEDLLGVPAHGARTRRRTAPSPPSATPARAKPAADAAQDGVPCWKSAMPSR